MTLTIASLPVGGGTLALCPMPGRGGAYDADLRVVLGFGPGLVLSMTTAEEMSARSAARLGADLADHRVGWRHLPVADYGVPGADVDALWPGVVAETLAVLAGGGRVLVHCMGGCGRSGMVVLRLMLEAGEERQAALARLRAVRPCAVETDAQMGWAAQGRSG
jgi:protein-tyrosine phosphatase